VLAKVSSAQMNEPPKYSGQNAFQFAARFCFPRLSGTKGEVDAQETALSIFRSLGFAPIEEEFQASTLAGNFLARTALMPLGTFLIAGAIFYRNLMPLTALIFFLLALTAGLSFALYCQSSPKFLGWRFKHWSKNIFVKTGPENPEKDILIVAHYDSKSQTFPIWVRIFTYYFAGIYSLLAVLIGIIVVLSEAADAHDPVSLFFWLILIAGLLDFIPLFNRLGNRSPGAVDNASAVGVTLELAKFFKDNSPSKNRLWFVLTGAEELGLLGARAYVEKHGAELDPKRTFVINLDSLGANYRICALSRLGLPGKKTDPQLNHMIQDIAEKNHLKFKMVRTSIGFATDAAPFLSRGYRAVSLGYFNKWIHTSGDNVDKIIEANLDDYAKVIEQAVQALDK
jgi:hypothetical protein